MSLLAGSLNRLVLIQRRQTTKDTVGQTVDTWTDVMSLWANVRGVTGLGSIKGSGADGVTADISQYSFRIRYRLIGIDSGMRLMMASGQIFNIEAVRHDLARREWTDLVCSAGGNDG